MKIQAIKYQQNSYSNQQGNTTRQTSPFLNSTQCTLNENLHRKITFSSNKDLAKIVLEKFDPNFAPKSSSALTEYISKFKNLTIKEQPVKIGGDEKIAVFKKIKNGEPIVIQDYSFSYGSIVSMESYYKKTGLPRFTYTFNENGTLKNKIFRREKYKNIPIHERIKTKQAPWIQKIENYDENGKLINTIPYDKNGYIRSARNK